MRRPNGRASGCRAFPPTTPREHRMVGAKHQSRMLQTHNEGVSIMKESGTVCLIIFSFICFLATRGIMEVELSTKLSRKGYKAYKSKTNLFDRWFFISARYIVRDKYSKFEGRIIQHTAIMQIIFVLNIVLHIGFLAETSMLLMVEAGILNKHVVNWVALAFFLLLLITWGTMCFILRYEYRKYYRVKEKRR